MRPAPLPVDFVICIDNSGTIVTPEQQQLIRETTMLLADLAEIGDRISVVAFGEGARVVTIADIRGDQDRIEFRNKVRQALSFSERRSDIGAALGLVAERAKEVFRPEGSAVRTGVLLSDGRLEPADGNAQRALEQIQSSLAGGLSDVRFYAVVLGDTSSAQPIPGLREGAINGQLLMRRYVARSASRFYHARSLDQLLDIGVRILSECKGINSLGETGEPSFKIDKTVESMSLIVRKRSAQGQELVQSADLRLKWPGMEPGSSAGPGTTLIPGTGTSIYWNDQYTYFDVITARVPIAGLWEIGKVDGGPVEFLSRIITPIALRVEARDHCFLNESSTLTAFLFDTNNLQIPKEPCRIQGRIASDAASLKTSGSYLELRHDPGTNEFQLEMPVELIGRTGRGNAPGTVVMQFVAERPDDPWFIRRSNPLTVELWAPFVEWTVQAASATSIPIWGRLVPSLRPFAGTVNPSDVHCPEFEVPPQITLLLERRDDDAGTFKPGVQVALTGRLDEQAGLLDALSDSGLYRYSYLLQGTTKQGPFTLRSPWYSITVRWGWEYALSAVVLFWLLLYLVLDYLAVLTGSVFDSRTGKKLLLSQKTQLISFQGLPWQLRLKAGYSLLLSKRITLDIRPQLAGGAVPAVRINGRTLVAGRKIHLRRPWSWTLSYDFPDGRRIRECKVIIDATVRLAFPGSS